jgi:dUTP pyrophosphatase
LKNGIVVANCEGVVDSDYVEQTFVMLLNISDIPFDVDDGMRIAQGEVSWDHPPLEVVEIDTAPEVKTDRNGGFGSTGI